MNLERALEIVRAAGYKVTQPRVMKERPTLNALGKPISPLYDPDYRIKTPLTSIRRLSAPQNLPMHPWENETLTKRRQLRNWAND